MKPTTRTDVSSSVGKLLDEENHVELLREGVRCSSKALVATEVSCEIGAAVRA